MTFKKSAIRIGTTTETENGDITYSTSLDPCVDLFSQIGAIRGQSESRIQELFSNAYATNPDVASRIALWARDIRGGAGERRTYNLILRYLAIHDFDRLVRLLGRTHEVGRFDDLFSVFEDKRANKVVLQLYSEALVNKNGLAAKWAPRQGPIANSLRRYMGLSPKEYRKLVVGLTKVVETPMCEGPKDDFSSWKKINYEHVPSVASARYSKAFLKRDGERYKEYLDKVKKGTAKINTSAVYPYDVIKSSVNDATADVMWNNLPDYVKEGMGFIPMVDVSGSMSAPAGGDYRNKITCMDVAISLGLYLAERNKSLFEGLMLTFSSKPQIFEVPKGTVKEKFNAIRRMQWQMNTNLDRAMDCIIDVAIKGKVSQQDMPTHLLIISDMEFDAGTRTHISWGGNKDEGTGTVSDRTKEKFKKAGYEVPNLVWWNLNSRHGHTPVRSNEQGAALISGFSPSIMQSLLNSDMTPEKQMLKTIMVDRYAH